MVLMPSSRVWARRRSADASASCTVLTISADGGVAKGQADRDFEDCAAEHDVLLV